MKYEWKKQEKSLYLPKEEPTVIEIPKMKYFVINGKGNPNGEDFGHVIEALYSLSYGVKMMPKNDITPKGHFEYTVYPLEAVWDMEVDEHTDFIKLDKNKFIYKAMIRQPDFVDAKLAEYIIEKTKKKKPNVMLDKVQFETIEDGLCVQMLHTGSYDDEPKSFDNMFKYCEANGYKRIGHTHREIYISDARKTEPSKLKTGLRIFVEKI